MEGLAELTGRLELMMSRGRLPHALLFTGPQGCGKNTLARALAAALNCVTSMGGGAPCGRCPSCQKIAKDIHPDLRTLEPSGRSRQIKLEDIEALRTEMAFKPYEGRVKVFIIRQADRLGLEAGNALLKTLEEPPPDSHLFLTCSSEAELMATVLSRCLRLRLPPLPLAAVQRLLGERRGLTGEPARLLAALSGGALGAALDFELEESLAAWQKLNHIFSPRLQAPARLEAAWAWVRETAAEEERWPVALDMLHLWWRETARLRAGGPGALEGPAASEAQLHWAARLDGPTLRKVNRAHDRLRESLSRFVKPELAFENYWLTVLGLGSGATGAIVL